MIVLAGARIVTPDRVLDPGTIVIGGDRITQVHEGAPRTFGTHSPLDGHTIVPGFIDVHVHGVAGFDTVASEDAVAHMASELTHFGVTAFCPTSVACTPRELRRMLDAVRALRRTRPEGSARVLPAHLESNFINPDYRGAQPLGCLRCPPSAFMNEHVTSGDGFSAHDIADEVARARDEVGIVTLAPELPGALDLIRTLVAAGHRVSLGHSGATYEEGIHGIDAGARHATHLFNRMTPFSHRAPGLIGAIVDRPEVTAEIILDGQHVHPAAARIALAALGRDRLLVITDGTAAAGLPVGTRTRLGVHEITVGPHIAQLDDGTFAGSVVTMDQAFRNAISLLGCDLSTAVHLCSTNPARALGLEGLGLIAPGALADLVVLDADHRVVQTYIGGHPALRQPAA
jgi:N-acetylglucosamine-6-phosphate deacetylase